MGWELLERPGKAPADSLSPPRLNGVETEVIDLFVQLSRALGLPKSIAEIYGLLFVSARPLAMDDLIQRLNLSKGSASQGLKFLRNLGAVRPIYVAGDRRDHYEAETELRNLMAGFLKEQLSPQLDAGRARLSRIEAMVKQLSPGQREKLGGRLDKLRSWEKTGKRFLPLVIKFLGK